MVPWEAGPRRPLRTVPARLPGTVRRTMHVDVGPPAGWRAPLPMAGAARDARTGADGQLAATTEAAVTAEFDGRRELVTLRTEPPAPWAQALIGTSVGGGFRAALAGLVPAAAAGSLVRQVLDDLPAASLISGYARMRIDRRDGRDATGGIPAGVADRMRDLCAGWRAGGVCMTSVEGGHGVPVQDCPPAPPLDADDPAGWHAMAPLGEHWMRRRRCLDVAVDVSGRFSVWAMFRDTVGDGGGAEVVLHEYVVRAEGTGDTVTTVSAEPRVLPFTECPGAVAAVGRLAGRPLGALPAGVPVLLRGTDCCTHLNDLLRSLGGAAALVASASADAV